MFRNKPVDKLQKIFQSEYLDHDAEEKLARAWAQVEKYMRMLLKKELEDRYIDGMDINDMIQVAISAETRKNRGLIKAVDRFCEVVTTLGSTVADGASTAFPPVTPCFAGLALVLNSAKEYADILGELEGLLQKCITGIDNLRGMNMNPQLATKVQRHLALFTTFKSIILNENLVQDLTKQLDEVTADRKDLILNQVHAKTYLDAEKKEWRKAIAQALSFNPEDLNQKEEPIRSCLGLVYKKPLLGTGTWIPHQEAFQA
ncbi:hypothetical protein ASPZODRAFT_15501 [Penicilliopsis zonata CBS 506.65]|uniref:Fungal STAND N-terminal Goodbye domain-containing protein n=1 Tax=Penicilliopsis zonata CBS 506.65 TaxID=1073090 RepID=A0A1L9SLS5_9EURO|nr:hypothetical protein ASPZODRAFT_15501 [Penicilliopsis zonata CBS 506.65]OJJ48056.1 hypothetical protein ASPZODRAFT_15501 [Penicilliopsis zonata CBS 506.65]